MVWSDKTLCDLMLRLLDRPEYASWSEKGREIRDLRDLLALSSPDEESPLLADFFRRNRPFWHAIVMDLNWEVFAAIMEEAKARVAIREHRSPSGMTSVLGLDEPTVVEL